MNQCPSKIRFSTFVTLLFAVLCSHRGVANSEAAKPVYRVEARRSGVSIGSFELELFPLVAPKAVHNFDSLVGIHFYDTTAFHRVIPGFMIQGGDPGSRHGARSLWGEGMAGQQAVEAEFSPIQYTRSTLGAARGTDTNSADSQFFVCVASAFHLNGQYTVYGHARSGMSVVDTIVKSPRDGADNPNEKIEMFITRIGVNDSVPKAPQAIFPSDGAVNIGSSSQFSWSTVSDAVLYEFEVATDSVFANIIHHEVVGVPSGSASSFELGLKKHYWRVRSNNGGHLSPYSPVYMFITSIERPQLLIPTDAVQNQLLSLKLSWKACSGAMAYHVMVATSPLFLGSSIISNVSDIKDTSMSLSGLVAGKRYSWKVAAVSPDYEGTFSPTWSFTTAAESDVQSEESRVDILVQPNPVSDVVRIDLHSASAQACSTFESVALYNSRGELLICQTLGADATSPLTLDVHSLSNGIYCLELKAGDVYLRNRFVVQH